LLISARRIAILLVAGGSMLVAAQANAAPVQCPSISFTRTPVPGHSHRATTARPHKVVAHNTLKRKRTAKAASTTLKKAVGPRPPVVVASASLPVLAPILPPDTLPATTPIVTAQPQATPIIGYRLKRSVKMVACEPVSLASAVQPNLPTATSGPSAMASFIPASLQTVPSQITPSPTQTQTPSSPSPSSGGGGTPPLNYRPLTPPVSAIPEPTTWAMMILGFFGLGAQLRRVARRARREATPTSPQTG
jgi:hypothetical protein